MPRVLEHKAICTALAHPYIFADKGI